VRHLSAELGGAPATWSWGRVHAREIPSLTQATGLGYGPRPAGGDPWTVNAADGGMTATAGPGWRMIAGWTRAGRPVAQGSYPGEQSENPASPWYANLIGSWAAGRDAPLPAAGQPAGPVRWELRP
jgi:penicillin amidase